MSQLLIVFALVGVPSEPVDFNTEIVPVLTHAGCNGGSCHGGAAGRGGFRLSLLGGNPRADYDAIVRELEGRRVDLARPDESLVYAKPTGTMEVTFASSPLVLGPSAYSTGSARALGGFSSARSPISRSRPPTTSPTALTKRCRFARQRPSRTAFSGT